MALIKLNKDELVPYVPFFDRKNDTDPLTCHIKYVSAVDYDSIIQQFGFLVKDVQSAERRVEIKNGNDKDVFLNHVKKVDNFLDDKGEPVSSVSEFYDSIDTNLREEILGAMSNQALLTKGQRKNSPGV